MKHLSSLGKALPLLFASWCVTGCNPTTPSASETTKKEQEAPRPVVFAGSYALAYFAERIGGNDFEVIFAVPPEEDPEQWIPDDETIGALQQADLILLNGADYENWPGKIVLPEGVAVDTSAGFAGELLEVEDAVTHQHGPHGVHSHGGTASIVWLDPQLAAQQTLAVEQALAQLRPDRTAELAARAENLRGDLQQLDLGWREALAPLRAENLLASHPVYHYLASRYELDLPSVHWEPTETPSAREWQRLDRRLRQRPVTWMIWEDEPTEETAAELSDRDIGIIVIDPAFHPPTEGDFLSIMRENIERVRLALTKSNAAP